MVDERSGSAGSGPGRSRQDRRVALLAISNVMFAGLLMAGLGPAWLWWGAILVASLTALTLAVTSA